MTVLGCADGEKRTTCCGGKIAKVIEQFLKSSKVLGIFSLEVGLKIKGKIYSLNSCGSFSKPDTTYQLQCKRADIQMK